MQNRDALGAAGKRRFTCRQRRLCANRLDPLAAAGNGADSVAAGADSRQYSR